MVHRIFVLVALLGAPAAALWAEWLGAEVVAPVACVVAWSAWTFHRSRLREAQDQALRALDPEGGAAVESGALDPYGDLLQTLDRASRAGEELGLARVRSNVRLAGLNEIWRDLARSQRPESALPGVIDFLRRESGIQEMALLRLDPRARELSGVWSAPAEDGASIRRESVRWSTRTVGGTVARVLRSAKPSRDVVSADEAPLTIHGERVRPRLRGERHTVLPMIAPSPPPECFEQGWLHRDFCPGFQSHPVSTLRGDDTVGPSGGGFSLGRCGQCRHYPVHGVMVLTDAGREDRPVAPDPAFLDSVAATVAAVLEHSALYRTMKGAERFRDDIFDAMLNGLFGTDQHGRVVFANRRARELTGLDDDVLGRPLGQVLELPGTNALRRTLLEGVPYLHGDAVLVGRRDGAAVRIPVQANLTPFRGESGAMKGAVCVVEDLRHVQAMQDEIRHLDTLAAIGRFASSLAHEIRNPLGGIRAGIGYLGRSDRLGDGERESLAVVDGEIDRLDGILKNLMSVARPREMELSPADLREIAQRTLKTFVALADTRQVELRLQAGSHLPTVHLDRDMIQQVLTNLVKNALEATSTGSAIDLELRATGEAAGRPDEADGVRIRVLDRGPGIAPEDLSRLFEPFFSRKSEGTGLGLYVSHSFVQRHGGSLHAHNRDEGGAAMELWLPTVPALMGGRHDEADTGRR